MVVDQEYYILKCDVCIYIHVNTTKYIYVYVHVYVCISLNINTKQVIEPLELYRACGYDPKYR